jgi:hypothetical protein
MFALPFTFDHEDYVQILTDMAERLGPALGWRSAKASPAGHGASDAGGAGDQVAYISP